MKYKKGDIVYCGGGNGEFCGLYKAIIENVNNNYYEVRLIEDYGCIWDKREFPSKGNLENSIENTTFSTFEEAKKVTFKDMKIKRNRDYIKLYFERMSS